MKSKAEVFKDIYIKNKWGNKESVSGSGSTVKVTACIRKEIENIINEYKIKSILDAPCGDFNWFKEINTLVKYLGIDIVSDLIIKNKELYPNKQFYSGDLTKEINLPKSDLIICRDCLVHLDLEDCKKVISNFEHSKSKYLLITHYPDIDINKEISTGDWRPINLELNPFNFTKPIKLIKERKGVKYNKYLGLWRIN